MIMTANQLANKVVEMVWYSFLADREFRWALTNKRNHETAWIVAAVSGKNEEKCDA